MSETWVAAALTIGTAPIACGITLYRMLRESDIMDVPGRDEHLKQLEAVIENAPIVLFALDDEGTFTLSEGRGLESLGLESGEVVGESAFDVYEGFDEVLEMAERALSGEEFSTTVPVGDRMFDVWYQPTFDDDGELIRTTGVALDVTDRVRHEQRLERLNEASRQLATAETPQEIADVAVAIAEEVIDQPLTAVWSYDSEDDCLRPMAATNSAATFASGQEETVGPIESGTFEMDVYRGDEAVLIDDYQSLEAAAHPETPLRTVLFVPLGDHGLLSVGFATVTKLDRSTRDLIEILARDAAAALDRADREHELARKNERLEEFARVISHDLRNPLNLIDGHVTLARDDEDVDEHLDAIERAVDRMDRLIENLLALAREGRTVGEPMPIELSSVASSAWSAVATETANLEIAGDTRAIMADRDRTQQLFENLFRNAVEHGGADVTVRVGSTADGFFVEDDGDGLPDQNPQQLFELGYSSTDGGTGIGLAIVDEIAQGHGWTVAATESPAGGARFEFAGVDEP